VCSLSCNPGCCLATASSTLKAEPCDSSLADTVLVCLLHCPCLSSCPAHQTKPHAPAQPISPFQPWWSHSFACYLRLSLSGNMLGADGLRALATAFSNQGPEEPNQPPTSMALQVRSPLLSSLRLAHSLTWPDACMLQQTDSVILRPPWDDELCR
jgi:hypothetical protein